MGLRVKALVLPGQHIKDPKDPRNSLFINFAQWICFLEPQAFVMENVKGLLSRKNNEGRKVTDIIKETFENLGYFVEVWSLNAAEYGVPQIRERIFIVGNKTGKELGIPPKTYSLDLLHINSSQLSIFTCKGLLPTISLWDAISDLPPLNAREGEEEQPYISKPLNNYQSWIRNGSKTLYNHVAMDHFQRLVERFKHIKWGESSSDAPAQSESIGGLKILFIGHWMSLSVRMKVGFVLCTARRILLCYVGLLSIP